MKISTLFGIVIIGQFIGYPAVAGISGFTGISNNSMSILLRSLIFLSSSIILLKSFNSGRTNLQRLLLCLGMLFWLCYSIRIIHSTLFDNVMLSQSPEYFWIWGFGGSFVPFLAVSLFKSGKGDLLKLFNFFFYIALLSSFVIGLSTSTYLESAIDVYDSGRLRLDALNPISLGHFGATLFLASLLRMFYYSFKSTTGYIASGMGILWGGYLLLASNSLGPLVATFSVLVFWIFIFKSKYRIVYLISIILVFAVFANFLHYLQDAYNISTYSRVFGGSIMEYGSGYDRIRLYRLALSGFSESPIFGSGLELESIQSYPHNVVIESFMATGILGGVIFLSMVIAAMGVSFHAAKTNRSLIWLATIVVQYMVAAQFSGAIYSGTTFWMAVGLATHFANFSSNSKFA